MRYKITVPPTDEQGSYTTIATSGRTETIRQQALWAYNSARAHDGLDPIKRMPAGTKYAPIVEFDLEGNYGRGWEILCCEETRKEARERLKEYRENEGGTYRIVRRSVKEEANVT